MGEVWSDPQFYVVTAAALWGLWAVVRPFVSSAQDPEGGCATCSTCTTGKADDDKNGSPSLVVLGGSRPRG